MTREEIESMPAEELTALLAERVMGWKAFMFGTAPCWDVGAGETPVDRGSWNPTTDANDLRELLRAIGEDRQLIVCEEIDRMCLPMSSNCYSWLWRGLTISPMKVCGAIALACCGGDA